MSHIDPILQVQFGDETLENILIIKKRILTHDLQR